MEAWLSRVFQLQVARQAQPERNTLKAVCPCEKPAKLAGRYRMPTIITLPPRVIMQMSAPEPE